MIPPTRRRLLAIVLLLALVVVLAAPVAAQNLRFVLNQNVVHLYINEDGTTRIVYDLTFSADPGSHPIDIVDIGLPNSTYSDMTASVGGSPATVTGPSPYVDPGVAVDLGRNAIQPGDTGTLHFEATVRNLIYQDSKDPEYASIEFSPTYFDSEFVHGTTRQEVNFHFPPGIAAEEPRYHDQEFTSARIEDDRVVYTWVREDAQGDREYVYGASFPQRVLLAGVVQKPPAFNINFDALCSSPVCWFLVIGGFWLLMTLLGSRTQRRRKMQYLPPTLGVEGVGIKRGLTAVEAAVLLEAPLNRVMTMILFSLIKKGQLVVESEKPLRVQKTGTPLGDAKLRDYEQRFLDAVNTEGKLNEKELREMVVDLIGDVNKKLTGFSRKETVAYYKDIAARAWQQVEAAETPEVLGERWGEGLEWTMIDRDWDDRTRRVFHDRPVVLPQWWWGYRPWVAGPARPHMPAPGGGGQSVTLPTLPGADFANTVVTGIENAANTVVGSVEDFASRVTNTTNPPPKPASSSGRSGGGYSCACACACAGCACACAGGGR